MHKPSGGYPSKEDVSANSHARRGRPPPAPRPKPPPSEWDGSPFGPVREPSPRKNLPVRARSVDRDPRNKPPIIAREEARAAQAARRLSAASKADSHEKADGPTTLGPAQPPSRPARLVRSQSAERPTVQSSPVTRKNPDSFSQVSALQKLPGDPPQPLKAQRSVSAPARRCKQLRPVSGGCTRSVSESTGGVGSDSSQPLPASKASNASEKPPSVVKAEAAAARRALSQPASRRASAASGAGSSAKSAAGDGLSEHGDAALLVLRSMLGARGSSEQFTEKIENWRAEHPCAEYQVIQEDPDVPMQSPQLPVAANGILVTARVRPVLPKGPDARSLQAGDFQAVSVTAGGQEVVVHACGVHRDGVSSNVEHKPFRVHSAYGGGCHGSVLFGDLMAPLVESAVAHSAHATALCYGQTGSGKTHTQGYLIERTARYLFDALAASHVAFECFELTGSTAYSLKEDSRPELVLFEGNDGVVHVGTGRSDKTEGELPELCAVASSADMLIQLFRAAASRRSAQDTDRNAASSRSHAFYRMYLVKEELNDGSNHTKYRKEGTCIEMVDLAGSESNKDTLFHDRERVEDAAKINSSLMALNDCVRKQSQGAGYIPFRADKLTLLLRPCFMKRLKQFKDVPTLLFIACLSPLASDTHQSCRTLAYAQQLSEMKARTRREAAEALKHRAAVGIKEWDSSKAKPSGAKKQQGGFDPSQMG